MKRCFYHGIEPYYGYIGSGVETVVKILDEGLKVRNEVGNHNDEKFNHVCLYKKNDECDYEQLNIPLSSARDGWINNCFVFVLNPDLEAVKTPVGIETNLVDEWRYYGNIPVSEFIGIALPYKLIEEYLKEDFEYEEEKEDQRILIEYLPKLQKKAYELNLPIYDSEQINFTDEIDLLYGTARKR